MCYHISQCCSNRWLAESICDRTDNEESVGRKAGAVVHGCNSSCRAECCGPFHPTKVDACKRPAGVGLGAWPQGRADFGVRREPAVGVVVSQRERSRWPWHWREDQHHHHDKTVGRQCVRVAFQAEADQCPLLGHRILRVRLCQPWVSTGCPQKSCHLPICKVPLI